MTLRAVRNDGVSVCVSDVVGKELLEIAAVFPARAVDGGRRRHRDKALALISSVTITERSREIDAFGGDILLIAVLPVEGDHVFDGPEVAGFVVVSSGVFDLMERELVLDGGCDGCASVGVGSLEAIVTVAGSPFLPAERLDQ